MLQFYKNTLCISASSYFHEYADRLGASEITRRNYVSYATYMQQRLSGKIKIIREATGQQTALIEFDSIPPKYRDLICKDNPNPERAAAVQPLINRIRIDYEAVHFYTSFTYPDGSPIPTKKVDNIKLWSNNAAIMNAVTSMYKEHVAQRAKQGKKSLPEFWNNVVTALYSEELNNRWPNNLPKHPGRLQEKFHAYRKIQYMAFVKSNVGNSNAVKINAKLLNLLATLSVHPTRPYNTAVVDHYMDFMAGRVEIIDHKTGVVYDPASYLNENGKVITFTEQAVWARLNKPDMQVKIDKLRLGSKDFNDTHRPHRHRHAPYFSFSKISMDDRDLVWKDSDTKQRVKAYYAYDVASGCRVGSAYSMNKDEQLFMDCLRDMFVFIDRQGFGVPLEVEVENHLVKQFEYELNQMFPLVHFCAPGNSQEKRAEHFNRYVKYQIEKNNHPGIGRWWLQSKYNRVPMDRVGADYIERLKPAEKLIAEDIIDTIEYNNSKHSDQKRYPGMTRMEVLIQNLNPNLPQLNKSHIYRYIGYKTETSIDRSQYCSVQYAKYMLPHPAIIERLEPNNLDVEAYYMPGADGTINEVYVYQNGRYIATCERIETYNEAIAERTEVDRAAKAKQDKYVGQFDAYVKKGSDEFGRVEIVRKGKPAPAAKLARERKPATLEVAEIPSGFGGYAQKALDDFFN